VISLCTAIQKFYVLPTQRVDLRTSSDYSHSSVKWLVFIIERECVYCAVRTESLKYNSG